MPTIEHQILTYCADVDPDEDQLQKIRGTMSYAVDMDRLIDLAVKEGLGGFLYKSLLKAGMLESITPQHKQKLYTIYYLTIRNNIKRQHALNTILDDLNQAGCWFKQDILKSEWTLSGRHGGLPYLFGHSRGCT